MFRNILILIILSLGISSCAQEEIAVESYSSFDSEGRLAISNTSNRTWLGPEFWANRLQDWQIKNGRIKALFAGPRRRAFLVDREISSTETGSLKFTSKIHFDTSLNSELNCKAGFELGIKGEFDDYRDSAIHGRGIMFLTNPQGGLFVQTADSVYASLNTEIAASSPLTINLESEGDGHLILSSGSSHLSTKDLNVGKLDGGFGLVSHCSSGGKISPVEFEDIQFHSEKMTHFENRMWGPILWAQHTISEGQLHLTAQMAPIGIQESQRVFLDRKESSIWKEIADSEIDEDARTASFHIENWPIDQDTEFRIRYEYTSLSSETRSVQWLGRVRKDPIDKNEFVIAGFTGNNDIGFPNQGLVENVKHQDPDFLFFSGDQLYERVGGFGVQRSPIEDATLDYLRKWYMFGWAYSELMRDLPTVTITDDHDVYHGNIWGAGGRAAVGQEGYEAQDSGGYKMPPRWVRMVERTQTSNLPIPFDPEPIQQNIGTYFTNIEYGGVSFAVIEDRKFKSAPKIALPKGQVINGWPQTPGFDSKTDGDVPGAVLLGDRQLDFLEEWSASWSDQTFMKVLLSQTIFANVATLPNGTRDDKIVPTLRILEARDYPPDDRAVQDHDSNGWPQTGRNKALRKIRKAFALHIAGDQHLGSTIQYGIDEYRDAPYALCVPAISNLWPRRWYPQEEGQNRLPNSPRYSGDFEDGFGNKISVYAVSNPVRTGKEPSVLFDRATGYGIAKLNRNSRDFELSSWPRDADPRTDQPYDFWPITANQLDNYGKEVDHYLEAIEFPSGSAPVVQIRNKENGEVLYTLRPGGSSFKPMIFDDGQYEAYTKISADDEWKKVE